MQTLDTPLIQVIGMPSKNQRRRLWPELAAKLNNNNIWIVPDPDATSEAREFATMIGHARLIHLPGKIDDLVNAGSMDKRKLQYCMDKAVIVK